MAILATGNSFTNGDQVTAAALNAAVNSSTFASGAVDGSTTQLSVGAIIVKDLGVTAAKLETATNGQLMIGNGTGFTKAALTAGTNIAVTNASGAITLGLTGTVAVANGGTGETTYTNGQLLIGNTTGNTLTKATLTAGTGITITNSTGSITIAAGANSASTGSDIFLSNNFGGF